MERIALFLDYDGTLAPIAATPQQAELPEETRRALGILARSEGCTLSIISGRSLDDLKKRVAIEPAMYAGNHGLEISGPGVSFVHAEAARSIPVLRDICESLQARLASVEGALVEYKRLTVTVHYRLVDGHNFAFITQALAAAIMPYRSAVRLTAGQCVIEVRPAIAWNKGSAIRWIIERLEQPADLQICFGDDLTDEDAFAALPDGLTVKVGEPEAMRTSARFFVKDTHAVGEFLQRLGGQFLEKVHRGKYQQEPGIGLQRVEGRLDF
jgi:trehalose-phosphatase